MSQRSNIRRSATPVSMTGSQFERVLANAASLSLVVIGALAVAIALVLGKVILAPMCFAIVVGLMFGPLADMMEKRGVPPALSAAVVVLLFIGILGAAIALFAAPLSEWVARGPMLWEKVQAQLVGLRQPLETLSGVQEQLKGLIGGDAQFTVEVQDGGPVQDVALMAPAVLADILLFLAGLYFFMATRHELRVSMLSLCFSRRMRWRTAHVFRDVELKVSKFLLSAAMINTGVGVATAIAMSLLGVPSPLLWGALAGVLNFIPYVGQAVMLVILFAVGLATQPTIIASLIPVAAYAAINLTADQIVFPHLVGRALTLNPFLIFVSIAFWLWIWGPIGGFVAVPSLLVLQSAIFHIVPVRAPQPPRKTTVAPPRSARAPRKTAVAHSP